MQMLDVALEQSASEVDCLVGAGNASTRANQNGRTDRNGGAVLCIRADARRCT